MRDVRTVRCRGKRLRHFNGIVPSLACILTKQQYVCNGNTSWKPVWNAISEANFKMSLDASVLKNLYLWCEFQSRLLFIISLLLKIFLTALLAWFHFCLYIKFTVLCWSLLWQDLPGSEKFCQLLGYLGQYFFSKGSRRRLKCTME